MPTGVAANVKDLEAKGFGVIKPDNGEAASRRAQARYRPLSARVAPLQACASARAHAAACHRPESVRGDLSG